jgi:hypothetical protein
MLALSDFIKRRALKQETGMQNILKTSSSKMMQIQTKENGTETKKELKSFLNFQTLPIFSNASLNFSETLT